MKDKVILITCATSGIGFQTALALANLGAHVVVTGRNQASGEGFAFVGVPCYFTAATNVQLVFDVSNVNS